MVSSLKEQTAKHIWETEKESVQNNQENPILGISKFMSIVTLNVNDL